MNIKTAVEKRVKELCNTRGITVNTLANLSGMTPSTVYSMLNPARKDIGVVALKKICDGLNITIRDFFDSDIFSLLEQELV